MKGLVIKGIGGFYTVLSEDGGCHTLRVQNKLRRQKLKPMVGDHILFQPAAEGEEGWMVAILPRKNSLLRPPVANIDVAVLVVAAASPDPDLLLLDRMLVAARLGTTRLLDNVPLDIHAVGTAEDVDLDHELPWRN